MTKRVKGLRKVLAGVMIPLAVTLSSGLNNGSELDSDYKKERAEKYLEVKAKKEAFETRNFIYSIDPAPTYKTDGRNCSKYVREVGRDFYDKNYFWAQACDRKFKDNVIHSFRKDENPYEELKELEKKGKLEKGMVLGVWHRPSDWDNKKSDIDMYGHLAEYTHNVIFRGIHVDSLKYANSESYKDSVRQGLAGKYIFDHEWVQEQDTISLSSMEKKGWKLKDLIDHNPVSYAEATEKSNYQNSEDS